MENSQYTQGIINEHNTDKLFIAADDNNFTELAEEHLTAAQHWAWEADTRVDRQLSVLTNMIRNNDNEKLISLAKKALFQAVRDLVEAEQEVRTLNLLLNQTL